MLVITAVVAASEVAAEGPLQTGELPSRARALDPSLVAAARSLAEGRRSISAGDLDTARRSLERARRAELLADYVDLFEARLLLASGRSADAAEAARRGRETHDGRPVAAAFAELLGEARLAAGDDPGAREAWQLALDASETPDRRAALNQRIRASEALAGDTLAADARRLPRHLRPAEAQLREAEVLAGRGRGEEALAAFDGALAAGLDPDRARRAGLGRGHVLFALRRYGPARLAFAVLLPDREARFWHARSLARSGLQRRAISEFEAIGASGDPEYGTWALYLAGTLLEDRGQTSRAHAHYAQVADRDTSDRGLDALWRLGWSAYGRGEHDRARALFQRMATRSEPLDGLRPRYWAARAAEQGGEVETARRELAQLRDAFPLSYYGWRAGERLGGPAQSASVGVRLAAGTSRVALRDLERVELLIEAELADFAQEELLSIAKDVRGLEDRKSVGRLFARTGDFHRAQRLVVDAYAESLSRGVESGNEALWWLSWPPAYRELITEVFPSRASIEPALVWAIMREESGYRPDVTSSAGARGLLQIMPATGADVARKVGHRGFDPDDLYEPRLNLRLGTAYLDELGRRFPGRLSAAIGSYNAGPTAVGRWLRGDDAQRDDDAWVEDIPYRQTRAYVKRVLRSLHVYRTVYGETALLRQAPGPAASGS